jgi:bacteriocin resistance YdeI/OmpD-like protein
MKRFVSVGSTGFGSALTKSVTKFDLRRGDAAAFGARPISSAKELVEQRRMRPSGLKALAARTENKSGIYSYEQRKTELGEPYAKLLKKNKAASNFFEMQPASYRKMVGWWIISVRKNKREWLAWQN